MTLRKRPEDEGQQARPPGPRFAFLPAIGHPVAIFRKLTGRLFNPLETTLFDIAGKNLPPEISHAFQAQLREINLVQRHHYRRYSDSYFYRVGLLSIGLSGRDLMALPSRMTRFAAIDLSMGRGTVRAQLTAIDGTFFNIEYSRNVEAFERGGGFSVAGVDVTPVALDPDHHRARPVATKPR